MFIIDLIKLLTEQKQNNIITYKQQKCNIYFIKYILQTCYLLIINTHSS